MWRHRGNSRPEFASLPLPGQESVWDYPRPPVVVRDFRLIEVLHAGRLIASSSGCYRVLETASPPTFYLPPGDVDQTALCPAAGESWCEWKGAANYHALADAPGQAVAWTYLEPDARFIQLAGYFAFYPQLLECRVAGERARAQAGGFYGGWVTAELAGPFKGDPGTGGW